MILIVAVFVGLLPLVPAVIYFFHQKQNNRPEATRGLVYGLNGFNVILGLMATAFGVFWLFSPSAAMAAATTDCRH